MNIKTSSGFGQKSTFFEEIFAFYDLMNLKKLPNEQINYAKRLMRRFEPTITYVENTIIFNEFVDLWSKYQLILTYDRRNSIVELTLCMNNVTFLNSHAYENHSAAQFSFEQH